MKLPICATVITFNEELNIERCLKSLHFCQEVIVVDSESNDRTVEIAKRFTDKVYIRKWDGYGFQKNYANAQTSLPWILSVDADEEATEALRLELGALFASGNPLAAAYTLPRKTIHFGRWIRYGGWYPNRLVRFFDKTRGLWSFDEIHEKWESSGNISELKSDLLHYSFLDFSDQIARNNHYSTLGARELQKRKVSFGVFKQLRKTFSKFVETYFLKLGFLDGYPGFIISVSAAYSVFVKWAKLWEIETNENGIHRNH